LHGKSTKKYRIPRFIITFVAQKLRMERLEQIKRPISAEFEVFKQKFDASLQSSNPLLDEVIRFIKQRKGKMMRPMLALLMAKMYGEIEESTYYAAISLELLHTASLVHDDVVDESDKRRGQSSVNAIYDNKVSVLVGDYLLATSLTNAALTMDIRLVELVSHLGQQLSEGEIIQLSNTNAADFSEAVYFDVIKKKTAALFSTAAEAGAKSVHSTDEIAKKAALIGELIGIAFQIKDDIFDYNASDELGKPTGNDMKEGKLTLPALYVLNTYQDSSMIDLALKIRALEASDEEIARFIDYVKQHGGLEYASQVMVGYRNQALGLLPDAASQELKDALAAYIDYVIERKK
jgi:octaprenyl-diphosphate synthase